MSVKDLVMEQYGWLAFLLNDREVGPLLTEAVDPNRGFSPQTFQAKLTSTDWWRNHSEESRRNLIQKHTDPATWKAGMVEYASELRSHAARLGVQLNEKQIKWFAAVGTDSGYAPNSQYMTNQMLNALQSGIAKGAGGGGLRQTAARTVQQMSKGEFMINMSKKTSDRWGTAIAAGRKTADDARMAMVASAAKLYPQFAEGLRAGQSMAELTDGYREIIASELELDPSAIDFSRGQWSKVLGWKDGAKGPLRQPTAQEVQTLARQDKRFWKTSHGRETDAQMTSGILNMFGKRSGGMGLA